MSTETKTKICSYFDELSLSCNHRRQLDWVHGGPKFEDGKVPSKKKECPECGRRVKQRICFCQDGCCVIYSMPRHKRKGWQKKPKPGSHDNRLTKRKSSRFIPR